MPRIVVGSYVDFAGAARGASALVAEGLVHGEVSIIASRPAPRLSSAIALSAGALGAVIAPGSVFAFTPDMTTLFAFAPMAGALAGALLGSLGAVLVDRRARARAEQVRVEIDPAHVARVEAILRASGATLHHPLGRLRPAPAARPLRLVPYRP